MGSFLLENPYPDFLVQNRIFRSFFFGWGGGGGGGGAGKPSTDHKSRKSTLWVDSSDQIQIPIFEIHSLNVFGEKDLKKVFLTNGFPNKNGTQHMPYMYDMLVVP